MIITFSICGNRKRNWHLWYTGIHIGVTNGGIARFEANLGIVRTGRRCVYVERQSSGCVWCRNGAAPHPARHRLDARRGPQANWRSTNNVKRRAWMGVRRKPDGGRSDLCILKYLKKFDLAIPMRPQERCTAMSIRFWNRMRMGLRKTRLIDLGRVMDYVTNP